MIVIADSNLIIICKFVIIKFKTMATKTKNTGLNAVVEKKLTRKQKEFIELMKKASVLGGKLFKEGKLKPL